MSTILDFMLRHQAALQAAEETRVTCEAENERDHAIATAEQEFEQRLELHRKQTEKYWCAIAEKRAALAAG